MRNAFLACRGAGLALLLVPVSAAAQQVPPDPSTYRVYTGSGESSSLHALLASLDAIEVLFLGESHNDVVGHALQTELFTRVLAWRDAQAPDRRVALSLEMFERDVQLVVEEYVREVISEAQFRKDARAWKYYQEDYAPTVEVARAAGAPIIAANAPRRYVNAVSRNGADALATLSEEALRYLAPVPWPPPSPAYLAELQAIMGSHGDSAVSEDPATESGFLAQSLWDATMAYSVATDLLRRPGSLVVHMVGSFHVMNGTGIPEQLARYRPGTRVRIVFVKPVDDVNIFPGDLVGAGDFVVLTDASLARPPDPPGTGSP